MFQDKWRNELRRWSRGLKVVKYYGLQDERKEMRSRWCNGDFDDVDVILTTYNTISNTPEELHFFHTISINYAIFYEQNKLKNMCVQEYGNLANINVRIEYFIFLSLLTTIVNKKC